MKSYMPIVGWLFCLLSMGAAAGGDDVADLHAQLSRIGHLQGHFEQRLYTQGEALGQTASGEFQLLRPGYFRWDIQQPDSQLIVATPEFLWHYDRDLETVTRRPATTAGQAAPLQILGGDAAALREQFQVTRRSDGSFMLRPLTGEAGFRELRLVLDKDAPLRMDIVDTLGQRVEIDFSQIDRSTVIIPADFAFEPPPSADAFFYEQ